MSQTSREITDDIVNRVLGTRPRHVAVVQPSTPRAPVAEREWPVMDPAAYYGLAGEVVDTIAPHSEADPVARLVQFPTIARHAVGPTADDLVEDDQHHTSLFAVLVGESSKARKGISLGRVRAIMKVADQGWSDDRLKGGLSSGEGLINEVRDERKEWNKKE